MDSRSSESIAIDEGRAIMDSRTPAAIEVADELLRVKDAIIPSSAVAEAPREIIDSMNSIADKVAPAAFGFSDARLADNAEINSSSGRSPPVKFTGLLVGVGSTSVCDDFAVLALVATDEFPFRRVVLVILVPDSTGDHS